MCPVREARLLTGALFVSRLFGFLLGSFLSGGAAYSYLLKEYKISNDLLTEDIYVRLKPNFYCILIRSSFLLMK